MWPPYFLGASLATANLRTPILLRARDCLEVVFQGLVGDFHHFLEVVVRLLLARARQPPGPSSARAISDVGTLRLSAEIVFRRARVDSFAITDSDQFRRAGDVLDNAFAVRSLAQFRTHSAVFWPLRRPGSSRQSRLASCRSGASLSK